MDLLSEVLLEPSKKVSASSKSKDRVHGYRSHNSPSGERTSTKYESYKQNKAISDIRPVDHQMLLHPEIMKKSPITSEIKEVKQIGGKSPPTHKARGSNLSVPHLEPVFGKKSVEKESSNLALA